jgi:hypothetical protein
MGIRIYSDFMLFIVRCGLLSSGDLLVIDLARKLIRIVEIMLQPRQYSHESLHFINIKIIHVHLIGFEPSEYNFLFPNLVLPLSPSALSEVDGLDLVLQAL